MAALAILLVDLADEHGRVSRSALREVYALRSPRVTERGERSYVPSGAVTKRAANRTQAHLTAMVGARYTGRPSNGRPSSKLLGDELVLLERIGAAERVGEDVVVVRDWTLLASIIREDPLPRRS